MSDSAKKKDGEEGEDDEVWRLFDTWSVRDKEEALINVFSFGWMEDGRLGYAVDKASNIQNVPRPVLKFRNAPFPARQYACKHVSAGNHHTLFLMKNSVRKQRMTDEDLDDSVAMISGLNQLALCEEPGSYDPIPIAGWIKRHEPAFVAAGHGNCFVLCKDGDIHSWGFGRYGILGHGNEESTTIPQQISFLKKEIVTSICCGAHHAVALTKKGKAWSWGRNQFGQLGRGHESPCEYEPGLVPMLKKESIISISCGQVGTFIG
jgi:alpha-tubulin suppressor-like RCC1 family protein